MSIIAIQNADHWHELRKQYVGGSEVAALFNACSYLTHLELWLIKRGEIAGDIEDNDRMFWGRMVEDAIAQGIAAKMGWRIENPHGYFICDDTQGMGCTPDRMIFKPEHPEPGLLQIKNVDRLEYMKWEDAEDGKTKIPPLAKQLQLQHELGCSGYQWGVLGVLVGGNDLKIFEYDAHPGAIAKIKAAITKFWESVKSGIQPQAVADDYEIIKELHPANADKIVDMSGDNEFPELCATAIAAAERRKAAEKEEKAAKASILQKMGDAGRATCTGFIIKKTSVTKGEYLVKAQSYQQLTIKEEKK